MGANVNSTTFLKAGLPFVENIGVTAWKDVQQFGFGEVKTLK